jgi:hypothetical protein
MKNNKNIALDVTFNQLEESKKLQILGIDEDVLKQTRFKGLETSVIIYDVWNGKTNAEKRAILKLV